MMKKLFCTAVLAALFVSTAHAQDGPKPGPEHDMFKKLVGKWDAVMKFGGMESKGTMTYKMELGGLWLFGNFEGEFGGAKFMGHSMESYDAMKKKYVSVWVDSMSTTPMNMEGTFDKDMKTMTMSGEGPGHDGKPTKHKSIAEMKDDNTILFSMYMGDGKEPAFTITYTRKK